MSAKNHYVYIAKKAATFSLLATFMLPGNTFATTTPVRTSRTFCSNLEAYVGKLDRRFGEKENQFETKKLEQSKKLAEREADRNNTLEKNRAKWSEKRDEQFQKLAAKATTEAQKKAVEDFKLAIDTAVTVRQKSVDASVATFRTGLETAMNQRKASMEQAFTVLKNESDTAIAKAKADCAAGVDEKMVKETLLSTLKVARAKLVTTIKDSTTNMQQTVRTLTETKKKEVEQAKNTFKTSYDTALSTLKSAFNS